MFNKSITIMNQKDEFGNYEIPEICIRGDEKRVDKRQYNDKNIKKKMDNAAYGDNRPLECKSDVGLMMTKRVRLNYPPVPTDASTVVDCPNDIQDESLELGLPTITVSSTVSGEHCPNPHLMSYGGQGAVWPLKQICVS